MFLKNPSESTIREIDLYDDSNHNKDSSSSP